MNNKQYFALGILVIILIYAYKEGVFSEDRGRHVDPDPDVEGTLSQSQYTNKVTGIHSAIKDSWSGLGGDLGAIVKELLNMNSTDLITIANEYADRYPNDEYPTLPRAVSAEYSVIWTETYYNKHKLLDKFRKLGLS